jgi:hypothetical protein
MTKPSQMVTHKNYNLNVEDDIVICLTSKLVTCLIDGVTLEMKSHAIASLLSGSGHVYQIMNCEYEVHLIWIL